MADTPDNARVITGVKIPFWDMVFLMVKAAIAAIPAMIILGIMWTVIFGTFAALFSRFSTP